MQGGNIDMENDKYIIALMYYKYKWAFALYDIK